jgi:NDP-sugar pyrophosphorylase family protein
MVKHLAILAGGKGTRMAAISGDLPKMLLPIGGKPVLPHQLVLALRSLDCLPEQFFVRCGDLVLVVDLQRMAQRHIDSGADLTSLAYPNDHPLDSDLLETDDND